jgi:hypothetical protein
LVIITLLKTPLPKNELCVKVNQVDCGSSFQAVGLALVSSCQQSVHLTLGILRTSQAVFYTLSFFWLDGFAVPHPSAGNANRWAVPCKMFSIVKYRRAI